MLLLSGLFGGVGGALLVNGSTAVGALFCCVCLVTVAIALSVTWRLTEADETETTFPPAERIRS